MNTNVLKWQMYDMASDSFIPVEFTVSPPTWRRMDKGPLAFKPLPADTARFWACELARKESEAA